MTTFGMVRLRILAIAGCLPILCSCSLMNPFIRSPLLDCQNASKDASCTQTSSDYAGGAASAIAAANDQRNLYIKEMGRQYWFNSASGLGMIVLSADAIFKGATGGASSHSLIAEGAAVAGLYGADTWLHNKSTEAAYIVGFQAITCTLLRTRAILLPRERDPLEPQDKFNLADFQFALKRFEAQIKTVDGWLSALQIDWDTGEEAGHTLEDGEAANLKRETGNVISTLAKSRKLLLTARAYEAEIKASGPTIRNQVDLIIASVNSQLAQSEPNIAALKGLVGTYTDPSKGIAGLQGVTLTPSAGEVTTPVYEGGTNTKLRRKADDSAVPADEAPDPRGISTPPNDYPHRVMERRALSEAVSELYARGRKINAVLDNAQHFYESTKRISACDLGGGAPPLEITPASLAEPVAPGKTLKFTVDGGTGIPAVSLTGSTGSAAGAKTPDLVLTVNGNSLIATVTILPDASGTLTLVASDKGQPSQQAKVTIDVEKAAVATKPTFKTSPGDKTIDLGFSTPSAKGGTLTGYTVTLSTGSADNKVSLKFSSPKEGTKATVGTTITGEISAVSGGNTTINLAGLTNDESYTVGLTATFTGASDIEFEDASNVKPAAVPVKPTKPSAPSIKTVSSNANAITITFDAPANGGSPITGYTATATNTDSKKKEKPLQGRSKGQTSINVGKCSTGEEYTVTVFATNAIGNSASSKPSSAITCEATQAKAPAAPTSVVGTPSAGGKITVTFVGSKDDGGGAVTLYSAAAMDSTPGNKEKVLTNTTKDAKATSIDLSVCKAGDRYTVAVVAARNGVKSPAAKGAKEVTCSK